MNVFCLNALPWYLLTLPMFLILLHRIWISILGINTEARQKALNMQLRCHTLAWVKGLKHSKTRRSNYDNDLRRSSNLEHSDRAALGNNVEMDNVPLARL